MKKMKDRLMHNLGLKVMALLFSVVLWMVAVDINDPVSDKYINNVPVQLVNTGTLVSQDKTYKVLNNTDTVRVIVRAPKSVLSEIDSQSVSAKADLSQITEDNQVPIVASLNSNLDVERLRTDKEYVELQVENKKTRQLAIEVEKTGKLPEGYVTGKVDTETNTMSITGPESSVDLVERAAVEVSLDNVTSNVEIEATIRLLDAEGNEVTSSDIRKSIESVKVTVPVLETKKVAIKAGSTGTPSDGYSLTGNVTADPGVITVAGRNAVLEKLNDIEIPETELDVTGAAETVTKTIDIRDYLPAGVSLADGSFDGTVTLTAEIAAIKRKTIPVEAAGVQLLNVPEGWAAEAAEGQKLQLVIRGLQENLNTVDAVSVTPHADLSELADADGNLTAGKHEVTVKFILPGTVQQSDTVRMKVRLTHIAAASADAEAAGQPSGQKEASTQQTGQDQQQGENAPHAQ